MKVSFGIILVVHLVLIGEGQAQENSNLCKINGGLSSVIVDIMESVGEEISQRTTPKELPITGELFSQIDLEINYPVDSKHYFTLKGKELQLIRPLDRDEDDISSIVLQVLCSIKATNESRTIPIIVRVSDVNDNSPQFENEPYEVSISEASPVGTTVFREIHAHDVDSGVNSLVEYFVVNGEDEEGYFTISLPHQGIVTLNRTLDFETKRVHYVTIASKDRAFDESQRKESYTTLTVRVIDSDDQGPAFIQDGCPAPHFYCTDAEYNSTVTRGVLSGILDILPERILAEDRDSIKSSIHYSFVTGSPPSFLDFFHIDSERGVVRQIRAVDNQEDTKFEIIIKATEISPAKRFTTAKLTIHVLNVDSFPPILKASGILGIVEENSPVGTVIIDAHTGRPITFSVIDKDLTENDPKPTYWFQLTTSAFKVNNDGVLVVAQENLDRDPPNPSEFQFQIIARENSSTLDSVSSPLVIAVKLLDVNDHVPILPPLHPIQIPGGEGVRQISKITAIDTDDGINSEITYSLQHISNNGKGKFAIDPITGLIESSGSQLHSGDQYALTIQATDGGGRFSQGILEIEVKNGPNLKAPEFPQQAYDVAVSEGSNVGAEVITLEAKDPEGTQVTYDILSGNELNHFTIGKQSGKLSVNGALDREDLSRYSIVVSAADEQGFFSTVFLNIRILDINDRNPEFIKTPYKFKIKEGETGKVIGKVEAHDDDESDIIEFETPEISPIEVNKVTGELTTKYALDYEKQKVHYVVVTARDKQPKSQVAGNRIATATVTVEVEDIEDEEPVFKQFTYEARVEENLPNFKVVQVEAWDPDTVKATTYYIKQGPTDKFSIDSTSGEIFTRTGLDYEESQQHILIIGLEENQSGNIGSTTTVIINVVDLNDIPPVFTLVPPPIRLEDIAKIGTILTKLEAFDADGTSPGNKVRFDLFGRGKAPRYFEIDHETGVVTIKEDLRKEMNSEYELDIRAYDLGVNSLSSMATMKIYVDHIATVPPDQGVGFADTKQIVEISESSNGGTLVKLLAIVNKPNEMIPIDCEIKNGNSEKLFDVRVTKEKDCLVSLSRPNLDFEKAQEYIIQVQINTLAGLISKKRSITKLHIKVVDENDNTPIFIFPGSQKVGRGKKLFSAISEDAQISTSIIQVKAEDKDSGKFGEIVYTLESENSLAAPYFQIDSHTGIISNRRLIDDVSPALLPFRLVVLAKDNANNAQMSHVSQVEVIVNIVSEAHRMILVVEGTTPDRIKMRENDIIEILQEVTNLIIGVEKITNHYYLQENGTIASDFTATDIWFYGVDPASGYILDRENIKIAESITSQEGSKKIVYFISSKLNVRAREVRKPLTLGPLPPALIGVETGKQWAAFPAALVALSSLIFIVSIAGICFICFKWSRYNQFKSQMERGVVSPNYERVFMQHSPSLKQYETQILQMRVNNDEVEGDVSDMDLHVDLDSHLNHAYSGESYQHTLNESSDSSRRDTRQENWKPAVLGTFQHSVEQGMTNPIYERSDDDDEIVAYPHQSGNYSQSEHRSRLGFRNN